MRIFSFEAVFMAILMALLSSAALCSAEDARISPHSDAGDCSICHVAPADKLRSWFTFGSTKRELRADLNQLCLKCHTIEPAGDDWSMAVGIGHATGKKTTINHGNLPLAGDGTINCATTCHNMHVTSNDRQQQLKHLRLPINDLCIACHDR